MTGCESLLDARHWRLLLCNPHFNFTMIERRRLGSFLEVLVDIEADLRREWWSNHGHDYSALYGDDGEMQCSACPADFKRQPLVELRQSVFVARLKQASEAHDAH